MKRFCAAILTLSLLAAALSGCGAAQSAPETTAAQTTFPTETAAPETTVPETQPETQPTATVDAVPVPQYSQYEAPQPGVAEPVITGSQTAVHVSTADEFLAAIASNTEIIVDAELIDFSTATGYGTSGGEHYRWDEEFDGPMLVVQNVSNLTVRGSGDAATDRVLSAVPRYAYVLTFENCSNIYVTHITLGHTQEPGYCAGGVLQFRSSQSGLVEDCDLYGCGTWGVWGENSLGLQVINNLIHDCSYGGVNFYTCQNVRVDGNTFRNLGDEYGPGAVIRTSDCGNITVDGADGTTFR